VTELRRLRRIEFAFAACGLGIVLLAFASGVDAIRFHLAGTLGSSGASLHDAVVIGVAAFDLAVFALAAASAWRQVGASARFLRRLSVIGRRWVGGHPVLIVDDAAPRAFCGGFVHPQVYVTRGALRVLARAELRAVVAHEFHHARRRDPLRLLLVRALSQALPRSTGLSRLAERHAAVAELAADAVAVRETGASRHLASALVTIAEHGDAPTSGIAPERVDHLLGRLPGRPAPAWTLIPVGLSLGLLALGGALVAIPGGEDLCSALLGTPAPALAACAALALLVSPIWLVARRAAAAVRVAD